jgi:hypothetical protein
VDGLAIARAQVETRGRAASKVQAGIRLLTGSVAEFNAC